MIGIASKYLSRRKRAMYERETDVHVVKQGLGDGLSEYRKWIYGKLSPDELMEKKEFYLSPKEIKDLQQTIFDNEDSDKSPVLFE